MTDAHIARIVAAYQSDDDVPEFSRLVPLEDIRSQQHNLSIPLYVRTEVTASNGNGGPKGTLTEAIGAWQSSSQQLRQSMDALFATLKEAGIGK